MFMGKRLKIIELGKYISAEELLYRDQNHRVGRDSILSGQRPENIYN